MTKNKSPSSSDRQFLQDMTKEQLIEQVLVLEDTVARIEGRLIRERLAPAAGSAKDDKRRFLPLRTGSVVYLRSPAYLSVGEPINRMFRTEFYPTAGLEQFTQFNAFRPDGSQYAPEDWPFMRVLKKGEAVRDEEMHIVLDDGTTLILLISAYCASDPGASLNILFKDVTGQREAERALQESEERHRQLFENMNDAFALAEPVYDNLGRPVDWHFLDANAAFASAAGFPLEKVIGHRNSELFPDAEPEWIKKVAYVAATGEPTSLEAYSPGLKRWFAVRFYSPHPNATAMIASDITERKIAEERLRESQALLRAVLDASPDPIFLKDRQSRILFANPATIRIWNKPEEEAIGKNSCELFTDPAVGERLMANDRMVLESKRTQVIEEVVQTPDGYRTYLATKTPYRNSEGEIIGVLGVARDITERKRIEEELRRSRDELDSNVKQRTAQLQESQQRYHDLAELLPETIFETDVHGNITYANRHGIATFGDQSEGMERGVSMRDIVEEKDHDRVSAALHKILQGKGPQSGEFTVRRKDGSQFEAFIQADSIENKGAIVGVRGVVTDLSESRKFETERHELQEQLRQAQKMEAIGTLAGGIAHDFNNMLAVVMGNAELAIDDVKNGDLPERNLEQILNAAKRGRDLVREILTFSRKSQNEKKAINVISTLQETFNLLRSSLPSTIKMSLDIQSGSGTILGDPTQVQQIVMNLATNAAHAMRKAGGTLTVRLDDVIFHPEDRLPDSDMKSGRYLKLSVQDTGTGMTEEVRRRAFEPFFTTKGAGQGTGMGLSVIYGIVKSYNGAISVETSLGKGSTFVVYLPKIEDEVQREDSRSPAAWGNHEHILFVDDEEGLANIAGLMLKKLGYEATVMTDVKKAWSLFLEDPQAFQLVITDQTMPDITGSLLARKMLKVRPDMPIILCTGYSQTISPEKARKMGIRGFLMKPLVVAELARAINSALNKEE